MTTKTAISFSKLTIETLWRRYGVFIVNFEHILDQVLVFLLLTFEQIAGWESKNRSEPKQTILL